MNEKQNINKDTFSTKNYVEEISNYLENYQNSKIDNFLNNTHNADIADVIQNLDPVLRLSLIHI